MTEHRSARRPNRAPRGRHTARPSTPSPRARGEAAADARARAFGDTSPSLREETEPMSRDDAASPPVHEPAETDAWETSVTRATPEGGPSAAEQEPGTTDEEPEPGRDHEPIRDEPATEALAPVAAVGATEPSTAGHAEPATDEPATRRGTGAAAAARGRRRATPSRGSLPVAAGWTALTSLVPGSGLIPTRLRALGLLLVTLLVLVVGSAAAWYLLGDPLPTVLGLASRRGVVIGALVVLVAVGLVWLLQILLANIAHNAKQRLRGVRRAVSTVLAVLLMAATAMPFALGAQSLYAAQGLLGNTTVFSGTGDGKIVAGQDPWAGTERLNVMLLGQDAGADRVGTRPDTIMVASIDTRTGRTALFSLPRNLQYVRFPEGTVEAEQFPEGFDAFGTDENLLNAVWQWADENKDLFPGDPQPGLTATRHAVEQTLGLKTDYYAMVDLQGFEDLVNAIGGVDINVERRIPIGGGTNQSTGGKYPITGWIEPGEQHLDGYHALWYARSREGSDDYNRMCRQQRIVRIVSEESDPARLALAFPQLVTATENNIVTDIPPAHLDAFVELAMRVKDSGFQSYPVNHDVDAPGSDSWSQGGHPDWDYLHQWVQASIEDSMTSTVAVSVKGTEASSTPSPAAPGAAEPSPAAESSPAAQPVESPTGEATDAPAEGQDPAQPAAPAAPVIAEDPLKSCLPASEQG